MPSEAIGKPIVEAQIAGLGDIARRLLDEYSPVAGWKTPNMNEVEAIWHRFDFATRRYWTGTWEEYKGAKKPEFPDWETLGE